MKTLHIVAAALALATGCDDNEPDAVPFEQPGLDDPSARMWEKAGQWYPEDHAELDAAIQALIDGVADPGSPRRAVAIVPPHASLKFSGPIAAELFARVELSPTVLLLAPDHFLEDTALSIWTDGPWLVPGHSIEIDTALRDKIQAALPELQPSREAFSNHESELMLPWLQYLDPTVKIVPVAIYDNSRNDFPDFDVARIEAYGAAIASVIRAEEEAGREVTILATTDLVHNETKADADVQNARLMEHITALDVQGLHDYVRADSITIGGEIVTAIMMSALTELGYDSMELLALGDSVPANGDEDDVVGYPAAATWRD